MGAIAENFNALLDVGVKFDSSNILVGTPAGQSASLLPTWKIEEIKQVHGVAAAFPGYQFPAKPGAVSVVSFGLPDEILAGDPAENDWGQLKLTTSAGHYLTGPAREVVLGDTIPKEIPKKGGDPIALAVKASPGKPHLANHTFTVARSPHHDP